MKVLILLSGVRGEWQGEAENESLPPVGQHAVEGTFTSLQKRFLNLFGRFAANHTVAIQVGRMIQINASSIHIKTISSGVCNIVSPKCIMMRVRIIKCKVCVYYNI